ncbi:hypothetical protein B0H10DRAFT_2427454 [Mycena sp. CBHHK59/15]|nr:hypothetical protein B0H10DRAFT_2427454 [Mycena sp. CBHHK59/15]
MSQHQAPTDVQTICHYLDYPHLLSANWRVQLPSRSKILHSSAVMMSVYRDRYYAGPESDCQSESPEHGLRAPREHELEPAPAVRCS